MISSRYSRQILFGEIGVNGQQRLTESLVVILGCGALGTVQAEALCRAGVGRLRIIDRDFVEESNLQRQTLFTEDDARGVMPKAVAAQRRLGQINSEVRVEALVADIHSKNIEGLVQGAACILDATDNFETRFLINDAAIKHRDSLGVWRCRGKLRRFDDGIAARDSLLAVRARKIARAGELTDLRHSGRPESDRQCDRFGAGRGGAQDPVRKYWAD